MWAQWIPWQFVIRAAARQKGFIDPLTLLSKFQYFVPFGYAPEVESKRPLPQTESRIHVRVHKVFGVQENPAYR